MAGKEQKWLLTHDSHELKKGEVYKGETLPLWLAGKAIPVEELDSQLWTVNSIKPNTDNTVSLTVAEYSDAIY